MPGILAGLRAILGWPIRLIPAEGKGNLPNKDVLDSETLLLLQELCFQDLCPPRVLILGVTEAAQPELTSQGPLKPFPNK